MPKSVFSGGYSALTVALVEARKGAGVTQVELADRLGKPQSFVSKFERGERRLDLVEVLVIARAIGADELALVRRVADALPDDAAI